VRVAVWASVFPTFSPVFYGTEPLPEISIRRYPICNRTLTRGQLVFETLRGRAPSQEPTDSLTDCASVAPLP